MKHQLGTIFSQLVFPKKRAQKVVIFETLFPAEKLWFQAFSNTICCTKSIFWVFEISN